jgi:hypothetical protein
MFVVPQIFVIAIISCSKNLLEIVSSNLSLTIKTLKYNSKIKNYNLDIQLYEFVKVKNLKSNFICNSIFNHLLLVKHNPISLCFMREFKSICFKLELESSFVIDNIVNILTNYKLKTLIVEDNEVNKIIKDCLMNNTDPLMRNKINAVTYAGLNI